MSGHVRSAFDAIDTRAATLKPVRKSRNSIFDDSWSISSPHSSTPSPQSSKPSGQRVTVVSFEDKTEKINLDELPDELQSILLPSPLQASFHLRFWPKPQLLLGEGRHASVYLASYTQSNHFEGAWSPCAVKRIHGDRESQITGLSEAWILGRLTIDGHHCHPAIIRLLSVKDERDHVNDHDLSRANLGRGAPPMKRINSGYHDRSFSDGNNLARSQPLTVQIPVDSPATPGPRQGRFDSHHSTPSSPVLAHVPDDVNIPFDSSLLPRRSSSMRTPNSRPAPTLPPKDLATISPRLLLVLELCPAGNLAVLLRRQPQMINYATWLRWAKSLTSAVAHAHSRKILHLDIKPANVFVSFSGSSRGVSYPHCVFSKLTTDLDVKLGDWSMAMVISPGRPVPPDGVGLGTPIYCAPELVRGQAAFGPPADIFALGLSLYSLISGREPYSSTRSPVERMLWISRGAFWQFEEGHRLNNLGSITAGSAHGGSSRALSRHSSRSLLVDDTEGRAAVDSPLRPPHSRPPALVKLLANGDDRTVNEDSIEWQEAEMALGTAENADDDDEPQLSAGSDPSLAADLSSQRYTDGTPFQWFLDGADPVPERVLSLIKHMTNPDPQQRPDAESVLTTLASL